MLVRVAVLLAALAVSTGASAQSSRRPTPHQQIERAIAPLDGQLAQLDASPPERDAVRDLFDRAETYAAQLVEARFRGQLERARSLERRLEWVARIARGRIEAIRAERGALEQEREALAAEDRRSVARAALERWIERRMDPPVQPNESGPPR